jgi:tryptophanyl-tRNA synthetase
MRSLTGIKPSGFPHLGNYFGAIAPAIRLQGEGEAFYFIADYHALTTVTDREQLRQFTLEVALSWLACGLDPAKAVIWKQSDVPEVQELAWLLSTVCPMGLLERCVAYKDAIAKGQTASHALFAYPVLMAADILLYQSDLVPVGLDQKQHVEVTRDLAMKFNQQFGEVFQLPEPRIQEGIDRIPGIDGQKMSKSYHNVLRLFGAEKEFAKLVMSIKTDSAPMDAPKPTGDSTLLALYRLVASDEECREYAGQFARGGVGYGDLKKILLVKLTAFLAPMRERYNQLHARPGDVLDILGEGARKAREVAGRTLGAARQAVGLD